MKRFLTVFVFSAILASITVAQGDSKEMRSAKKALSNILMKDTRSVYDVDFNGCEAAIKVMTPSGRYESHVTANPPQGFAGFPIDLSNSFDNPPPKLSFHRIYFDLKKIDPTDIEIVSGYRKGSSIVRLTAPVNKDAITTRVSKSLEPVAFFAVSEGSKNAEKIRSAFSDLINGCSATK